MAAAGLETVIDIRLGDGLNTLAPDEADDIVIAGMGGETIAAILEAAPWIRDSRYPAYFAAHDPCRTPASVSPAKRLFHPQGGSGAGRRTFVSGRCWLRFPTRRQRRRGICAFSPAPSPPPARGNRYIEKQRRLLLRRAGGLRSRPLSSAAEKAEADRLEEAAAALRAYGEEST